MNKITIALDGPSGAGKSSLAKEIAKRLDILYLDTGALYRTIGLHTANSGVDPDDPEAVAALLPTADIDVELVDGHQVTYLGGEAVGDKIRTPEMSDYASKVSAIPAVRAFLLELQRTIAKKNSVIMDGRD
ncbi:MAG: cytidylate kinase, partial [Ruminococcaceae bacterium]|nr:cytidylate kinase [Oscillospiraceae bacterium]